MTFWDHLESLRGCLAKIAVAVLVAAVVAFCFKDALFAVIFAPKEPDFITYRLFALLAGSLTPVEVDLINTELTQQFMVHLRVSLWVGLLVVSPYVLYLLFGFVAPALYSHERSLALRAVGSGYVMFLMGVALSYLLIFPLTFRFLGGYQVRADVVNLISLTSYISTLLMLCFVMGVVFELPVLCWLLSKAGILKASMMQRYRRHAMVAILVVGAIITPTADALTLAVVALPIYLLYEASIWVVKRHA